MTAQDQRINLAPEVVEHDGVLVVRDDLFPGGSKARFVPALFEHEDELVYASPCEGGAQTALAHCAAILGKRATIFVAKRASPHPRSMLAKQLGAKVLQVEPGYLSVVQARSKKYAQDRGVCLLPFGLDVAVAGPVLAHAARSTGIEPDEVWCAGGSGVLARALRVAWPKARLHIVQVGKDIEPGKLLVGASVHVHPLKFGERCKSRAPFNSDPHYDAKAWEICQRQRSREGVVLFWNVTGDVVQ